MQTQTLQTMQNMPVGIKLIMSLGRCTECKPCAMYHPKVTQAHDCYGTYGTPFAANTVAEVSQAELARNDAHNLTIAAQEVSGSRSNHEILQTTFNRFQHRQAAGLHEAQWASFTYSSDRSTIAMQLNPPGCTPASACQTIIEHQCKA